jgi:hypothetical protein
LPNWAHMSVSSLYQFLVLTGVSFVFKSLMKSHSKVRRTEVLQRNIPED